MEREKRSAEQTGDLGIGLIVTGVVILVLILAFGARKLLPVSAFLLVVGMALLFAGRMRSARDTSDESDGPSGDESEEDEAPVGTIDS